MSKENQQFDSVEDMLMAVEPEMAVEFLKDVNADLKQNLINLIAVIMRDGGQSQCRDWRVDTEMAQAKVVEYLSRIDNAEKQLSDLRGKVVEFREYMIENINKAKYLSEEHNIGLKIFDYFDGLFGTETEVKDD